MVINVELVRKLWAVKRAMAEYLSQRITMGIAGAYRGQINVWRVMNLSSTGTEKKRKCIRKVKVKLGVAFVVFAAIYKCCHWSDGKSLDCLKLWGLSKFFWIWTWKLFISSNQSKNNTKRDKEQNYPT